MRYAALVMVGLALMLGVGRASMLAHQEWSARPEIRALQQQLVELDERRFRGVWPVDPSPEWRRAMVREDLTLADEAWEVAEKARRLWRPALFAYESDPVGMDREAVEVYLNAFTMAADQETSAICVGSDLNLGLGWRITMGPRGPGGLSSDERLEQQLGRLRRRLAEVVAEIQGDEVRPAPGVMHLPPRDELHVVAHYAHKLAEEARSDWEGRYPPGGFELYVRCVGLSLLADGYVHEWGRARADWRGAGVGEIVEGESAADAGAGDDAEG